MPTALITGVAGFIGSNLADALLDRSYTVRGVDNFATGRKENLDTLTSNNQFSFNEIDIRNGDEIAEVMDGVDYVFHQAAVSSVPRSVEDPVTTTEVNCTGTATVLDAAKKAGVDTVVVASSSAVYGSSEVLPKTESMEVSPESPYALSKYYTEQLALQCNELYEINTVALRYFNVFGPRQDPSGPYAAVIPKFIDLMSAGERPIIFDDGEQTRDFIFVEDVVRANIAAVESSATGVYNVARGERVSVNDLVDWLNEILDTEIEPIYDDPRSGEIRHSGADISRANKKLGFAPQMSLREGLKETVAWFK